MYITWLGINSFKIQTADCTLITDPYGNDSGLRFPRLQTDLVTISDLNDTLVNNIGGTGGTPYQIDGPGEFEVKKIYVRGVPADETNPTEHPGTLYYFEIEGVSLAHLGALTQPLTPSQMEVFEGVDVLLIPVGNKRAMSAEHAADLIGQVEPRIVIPMYYKIPGLKTAAEPITGFLKAAGASSSEEVAKLKVTKRDLPQSDMQIIVLKP